MRKSFVKTACSQLRPLISLKPSGLGFTMAEILLSLTIIGVVAAITLPSLTGNINERTWNTQRKALFARFSQAIALMPSLNGYGTYRLADEDTSTSAEDTATETFITEGLSKVLKINNICDNEHLADCGIVTSYTNLIGSLQTMPKDLSELNNKFTETVSDGNGTWTNTQADINPKSAAFETANGESIVVYYNPNCNADLREITTRYIQPFMCANFIYDLNGNKGPNTVGKDIGFITALYPSDSVVVAPMPMTTDAGTATYKNTSALCRQQDSESRMPNINELYSMFYNQNLIGISGEGYYSGTRYKTNGAYAVSFDAGYSNVNGGSTLKVRCIKR